MTDARHLRPYGPLPVNTCTRSAPLTLWPSPPKPSHTFRVPYTYSAKGATPHVTFQNFSAWCVPYRTGAACLFQTHTHQTGAACLFVSVCGVASGSAPPHDNHTCAHESRVIRLCQSSNIFNRVRIMGWQSLGIDQASLTPRTGAALPDDGRADTRPAAARAPRGGRGA